MRVLVISPHPDDESIGCGGTIRKHVEGGDSVHVVFLTSGEKGGHGRSEEETIAVREREARTAATLLGIEQIDFFRLPDGSLRSTSDARILLRQTLTTWKPEIVYIPHTAEMHSDHRAAVQLLRHSCQNGLTSDFRVLMYEVWTPLQNMDEIVDITPYVAVKRAAILAYESQCTVVDFEAAALGLNRYRGEMHCWPEGEYAEVFSELHLTDAAPGHRTSDGSEIA